MMPATYTTFPAFACEFTENDDIEDAKYRLVQVGRSNWAREPVPVVAALQTRLRRQEHRGKGLLLFKPREAEQTLQKVGEEGGFMEVENFKREVVMIKQDAGVFSLSIDKAAPRTVASNLVAPWSSTSPSTRYIALSWAPPIPATTP